MMFKHFDKDRSGRLNAHEFKSCLRALGYDLPMVEEGQPDPEFEAILSKWSSIKASNFKMMFEIWRKNWSSKLIFFNCNDALNDRNLYTVHWDKIKLTIFLYEINLNNKSHLQK